MYIEKIIYRVLSLPLRESFETSFGLMKNRTTIIVEVVDREGLSGYGEIPVDRGPWYSYETIETALSISLPYLSRKIVGREIDNLSDLEGIFRDIRGHNMAKAGHEMALIDLIARRLGEPVYELIGGVHKRIESGVSIGVIGDMNRLLNDVARYLDIYKRIKIKVKPGWDSKPLSYIRSEYGDIPLQVDGNGGYDYHIHRKELMELDNYRLLMIEQPFHYEDLYYHRLLQKEIKTKICLDESIKSIYDVYAAISLGSCKVINIKPARVGGLLITKAINDLCKENMVPVWIGGLLETGIGRGHLVAAATLDNVSYPNDISGSDRYYDKDIVDEPWTVEKGYIYVRNRAGIGVELKEDNVNNFLLKEYRV
jgi:O-succinylbenzoate synthase